MYIPNTIEYLAETYPEMENAIEMTVMGGGVGREVYCHRICGTKLFLWS